MMLKYFLLKFMQAVVMQWEIVSTCLDSASIMKSLINNGVILRIYLLFGTHTLQKNSGNFSIKPGMNRFHLIWENLLNVRLNCTCSGELHESFSHHSCL